MSSRSSLRCFVTVKHSYPHHESLRGQVGLLKKRYDDGTVLVVFEEGPCAGDKVCMDQRYVEVMS